MMRVYTDGGNSPTKGTYGSFLLEDENGVLVKLARLIFGGKIDTNNGAEYAALIAALEYCVEQGITELECFTDSLLMVRQVNKEWRVEKPHLRELAEKIWELLPNFDTITIAYTRRKIIVSKLGH